MKKGDKVWTFCWNGEADYEIFDCWGNLNGSKGDGLYIENPFESFFISTKEIFETRELARKAGASHRLKSIKIERKQTNKRLKDLDKEEQKLQKLLKK